MQQTHDGPSTFIFCPLHPPPPLLQSPSRLGPTTPPPSVYLTPTPPPPPPPPCLPLAAASNVIPALTLYSCILFMSVTLSFCLYHSLMKLRYRRNVLYVFEKEPRVTLSFVVKFKLVTTLLLFIFTLLQLPLAASLILGLSYALSVSRVVI